MKELDEKGFVFLDDKKRPWWCRMWEDRAWLFYWHAEGRWVSYQPITQMDVWQFPHNLTAEQQQLYHDQHEKKSMQGLKGE
jgi:hypothetical protein